MMAKAVANATTAAFITMVGSEFVQKYLGEGPRMVSSSSSSSSNSSSNYFYYFLVFS